MKHLVRIPLWLSLFVHIGGCGDDLAVPEPLCDEASLQSALDAAMPGDVVLMGDCTVEGEVRVPAGVTLSGGEASILRGDEGRVVDLGDGALLLNLSVESTGTIGVGAGSNATLEGVRVEAARGVAVAVRGGSVSLQDVELRGPVMDTADPKWLRVAGFAALGECTGAECECTPGESDDERVCDAAGRWATWAAVYGLYADGATLTLRNVSIEGFAEFGAVLNGCTTDWEDGSVRANIGVGVLVRQGSADLRLLEVTETSEGVRGRAAYAVLASDGAAFASSSMELMDNERYGLVLLDASGVQNSLVAMNNGDAAIWVGTSSGVRVEDAILVGNGFAGMVLSASDDVVVEGGMIADTRSVTRTLGSVFGVQEIGDGMHISASTNVVLDGVTLRNNERGAILVDTTVSIPTFTGVDVEASTSGFGAEGGSRAGGDLSVGAPAGWDDGILRGPVAAGRDGMAGATFDIVAIPVPETAVEQVGIVFPMF